MLPDKRKLREWEKQKFGVEFGYFLLIRLKALIFLVKNQLIVKLNSSLQQMIVTYLFSTCTSQWFAMKIFSMPEQTRTRQVIQIQNKYPTFMSHPFFRVSNFHIMDTLILFFKRKEWFHDAHFCFLPIRCKIQS